MSLKKENRKLWAPTSGKNKRWKESAVYIAQGGNSQTSDIKDDRYNFSQFCRGYYDKSKLFGKNQKYSGPYKVSDRLDEYDFGSESET